MNPRLAAGLVLINSSPSLPPAPCGRGSPGRFSLGLTAVSLTTLLSGLATPGGSGPFIGTMIDFDPGPLCGGSLDSDDPRRLGPHGR